VITVEQLHALCPGTPFGHLLLFVEPIAATFDEFQVSGLERRAAFVAQYAHETMGFSKMVENLMYTSPEQLRAVHPTDFDKLDEDDARGYVRQPERIANRVYANQNGNGPEASGDGWRFIGRGLPHCTGRGNYLQMGRWLRLDLVEHPELLEEPVHACRAGGAYWLHNGCNELADRGDFRVITRRINGAATDGPPSDHESLHPPPASRPP
jgi:putative chitinase